MRCEHAQELLSDYYEGSVQNALLVPLENHLEHCSACREQLEGLQEVWRLLDTAAVVEPPVGFHVGVWQRIDAERLSRAQPARRPAFSFDWRSLFTRPALGWAAAILVVILLSGVVVPGVFTQARLLFPWNVAVHPTTPRKVAGGLQIGQPQIVSDGTKSYLKIPIVNPGREAMAVDVTVENGVVENRHTTLTIPAGSSSLFPVTAVSGDGGGSPITVNVTWQNGASSVRQTLVTP